MDQKILYIGANSSEKNINTKINNESEAIQSLMDANNSEFLLVSRVVYMVNQVSDLIQRKTSPQIIHISGHATEEGEIEIVEKQDPSKGELLRPYTLVEFLKNAGNVYCVVLNFCYSKKAADLIAEEAKNVGCVIGVNGEIDSTPAVDFSKAFYKSLQGTLLNDQSFIVEAFDNGQAAASQITKKDTYTLFGSTFKKVSIFCLGHLGGSIFLDGRTADGTVGLVRSTKGFTGTEWEMNELSFTGNTTVVTLKCLGDVDGSRFLDGRTREGTVALAPTTIGLFTGTRWEMNELSSTSNTNTIDVTLKCLGDVDGSRFLNGNTVDGSVDLAHSTEGVSGTKWRIMLIS